MKTIIAGSRSIKDEKLVNDILNNLEFEITEVVCGIAAGVDTIGGKWGLSRDINVVYFPANWNIGITAGFIRNEEMAQYADCLVLIRDGVSKGSLDMLKRAKKHNLKIDLYDLSQPRLF